MPTPTAAASAYASLAKLTAGGGGAAKPVSPTGGMDFASMLKDTLGSVMEAGRKSDAQTQAVAAGKSNIVDVVTAVAETEVAVEALVSIRDRVIQSYEEIMRMPI